MTSQPSRRDFLRGSATGGRPDESQETASSEAAPCLVHVSRPAMACEFEICLPAAQMGAGTEIALEALDQVERLEEQMAVFRPESEISRINRLAALRPVEVEPRLFEVLELAMRLYRETQGAYDITSGPLWEVWGFARRAGAIPSDVQLAEARGRVGGHLIELDPQQKTVRFLRPGVQLNLGSIGKGYAVDCCAERLRTGGIGEFLIHGGQSSAAAAGRKWTVGLRDPLHPARRLAELRLCDRALGTSGAQFQSFRHRGRRFGHILDPRTGWPAEGVLSATVLAPTATLADGLSTAFYVMGPETAGAYCQEHPELAAVLFTPTQGGRGWEMHTFGAGKALGNLPQ